MQVHQRKVTWEHTAQLSYSAGRFQANYISRSTLDDGTVRYWFSTIKNRGCFRDPDNNDLTSAGVVWRVVIREHFFKQHTGV